MKFKNLIGKRFGSRIVVSMHGTLFGKTGIRKGFGWMCVCDCGKKSIVSSACLNLGTSNSCGCGRIKALTSHGESYSVEYKTWGEMRGRCSRKKHQAWHRYGGRGIKVCKRWDKFTNFLKDMGRRPTPDHSLDRKNNDGNYCPSNCKWSTWVEQNRNTSSNRRLIFNGKIKP